MLTKVDRLSKPLPYVIFRQPFQRTWMCRSISHYLNMKYLGSVIVMGTDAVFNAYSMQPTIISAIYWRLKEYAVQRLHKRPTFISITRIRIGIQRNSVYWKQLSWLNELGRERGGGENKRFSNCAFAYDLVNVAWLVETTKLTDTSV